jgi:hypothetical protein
MTMLAASRELTVSLRALREELVGLRTIIREDAPGRHALEDRWGDAIDDLLGWLEESLLAALEVERAGQPPADPAEAWQALAAFQESFSRLQQGFSEFISYEWLGPLLRFGRQRGGAWQAWTGSVKQGLDRVRQPMHDLNQALFRCWQEISEGAGKPCVSVRSTNIGQQISVPRGA